MEILAVAILAAFGVLSFASTAYSEGVFVNCGGPAISESSRTWQSDSSIAPGGSTFYRKGNVSISHNETISSANDSIFQSVRYFGSQSGGINSYSIAVPTSGYHIVRLYFAEILYQSPKLRRFSVWIQDTLALKDFTLEAVNTVMVKEYYIPILTGTLNVTFVRGILGDPMISAIEVAPANSLYPWLTEATTRSNLWIREFALNCGDDDAYWPDAAGRMWMGDIPFAEIPAENVTMSPLYRISPANSRPPAKIEGTDISPEYLPSHVYRSGRLISNDLAEGPRLPLLYNFPAAPDTLYRVRFHLAEIYFRTARLRILNFTINDETVLSNIDTNQVAFAKAFPADFTVLSKSKNLQVAVWAEQSPSYKSDPLLNGVEIFRSLPHMNISAAMAYVAPAPPPAPPSPPAPPFGPSQPATSARKAAWQGVAVGASLMLLLFGVVALFLCMRMKWCSGTTSTDIEGKTVPLIWSGSEISSNPKNSKGSSVGATCLKLVGNRSPSLGSDDGIWAKIGGPSGTRPFTFEELQKATKDFSADSVVGKGGFGLVYRAMLNCGTEVAVKRLALESEQGEREFTTEVELLTRLHHRNLVNLIGYCEERSQLMLVYEFVPNGTLREYLVDEDKANTLGWPARLRILLGAARGIEYLHQGATPAVIHRDIKTSNILLESTLEAKVADFGLSKLGKVSINPEATHISTAVRGTMGYLDPQYYKTQRLTEKSDVYSFGVVILEVITGKLPIWIDEVSSRDISTASTFDNESISEHTDWVDRVNILVDWAVPPIKSGQVLQVGAPQLQNLSAPLQPSLQAVAEIAARCVEMQPRDRPTMSEVVRALEGASRLVAPLLVGAPLSSAAGAKANPLPQSPQTPPTPSEATRPLLKAPKAVSRLAFGSSNNA